VQPSFNLCDSTDLMIWLFGDIAPPEPAGAQPVELAPTEHLSQPLALAPTLRVGDASDPGKLIDCDADELQIPALAPLTELRQAPKRDNWRGIGPTIAWLSSLLVLAVLIALTIAL
jgi:hypothetical protein